MPPLKFNPSYIPVLYRVYMYCLYYYVPKINSELLRLIILIAIVSAARLLLLLWGKCSVMMYSCIYIIIIVFFAFFIFPFQNYYCVEVERLVLHVSFMGLGCESESDYHRIDIHIAARALRLLGRGCPYGLRNDTAHAY